MYFGACNLLIPVYPDSVQEFKTAFCQTVPDTAPIPWAAAAFSPCCIPCSREPRCPWCFYRPGIPARCDPWSVLSAGLAGRSSGTHLLPGGVSTTGILEVPLLCGASVSDLLRPDHRRMAGWFFFVSFLIWPQKGAKSTNIKFQSL